MQNTNMKMEFFINSNSNYYDYLKGNPSLNNYFLKTFYFKISSTQRENHNFQDYEFLKMIFNFNKFLEIY